MNSRNDDSSNAIRLLPDDLRRYIISFLPRSKSAELIHNSLTQVRLRYVRNYKFTHNTMENYKYNVWEELKPSTLQSCFYGDNKHIVRTHISKGEYIRLEKLGIVRSEIRFW